MVGKVKTSLKINFIRIKDVLTLMLVFSNSKIYILIETLILRDDAILKTKSINFLSDSCKMYVSKLPTYSKIV